jgi:hypothetical protein
MWLGDIDCVHIMRFNRRNTAEVILGKSHRVAEDEVPGITDLSRIASANSLTMHAPMLGQSLITPDHTPANCRSHCTLVFREVLMIQ